MKEIIITWEEVGKMIDELALKIKKSGEKIDGVFGVPRGGLPLAVILSYKMDIPVLLYPTENTLVVDDISDNGYTLQRLKNKKIATIYTTDWTITQPNWFIEKKLSKEHWLVFPWEKK